MTHTRVNRYWMIELKIRHNLLRLSQFDILTFNKHHLVLLLLSQFVAIFIICGKLLLYWPIFQAFFTIFPAQKPSHHFVMPHNCFWTTIECFLLFFCLISLFYCCFIVSELCKMICFAGAFFCKGFVLFCGQKPKSTVTTVTTPTISHQPSTIRHQQ